VHNSLLVHVEHCRHDLPQETCSKCLSEDAVGSNESEEVATLAQLHYDSESVLVFEDLVELGDVGVVKLDGDGNFS
jgi:hypothetical protein